MTDPDHAMQTRKSRLTAGVRPWLAAYIALVVVGAALPVPQALAQPTANPPERLTCQGFLVDGNGVALGKDAPKNYDVIFRIFNDETSGATLWGEQQTVTVDNGYFSVLLGEGAPVPSVPNAGIALSSLFKGNTASERYVGITVKGLGAGGAEVDILPRLRLLSSPYAFLARQANKLVQDNGNDLIGIGIEGQLLMIYAHPSASVAFAHGTSSSLTETMRIASNGNVTSKGGFIARGGAPTGLAPVNFGYSFSGNGGDDDSGMFSSADGVLQFFTNSREAMRVAPDGRIGIGTSNPEAPLHVATDIWRGPLDTRVYRLDEVAIRHINAQISIKTSQGVESAGFYAVSDERSKDIVRRTDTEQDLETVQRLRVTDYRKKDRMMEGDRLHKGFIAQEVQAVIPEAVRQSRAFIPNIYSLAEGISFAAATKALRVEMPGAHGLQAGDQVRVLTDDASLEREVIEVPDSHSFVIDRLESAPARLFVYGKEVDDSLSVDYDRLFTTGIGAIQELAKQVELLRQSESRVAELERKVSRLDVLQRELDDLRATVNRFAALEKWIREAAVNGLPGGLPAAFSLDQTVAAAR